MAIALGLGSFIGIGHEATYGTAAARTDFFRMIEGGDGMTTDVEKIRTTDLEKSTILNTNVNEGRNNPNGTIRHEARFTGFLRLLQFLFAHKPSPTGSVPYTWTFEPQDTITDIDGHGLSIEIDRGDEGNGMSFLYSGCWVNGWTISFDHNSIVQFEWSIIGKSSAQATVSSPTYDTSSLIVLPSPATSPSTFFTFDEGGANITPRVLSATISFARNWDEERYEIESQTRSQPTFKGLLEITGSVEVEYEDAVEIWDHMKAPGSPAKDLQFVVDGPSAATEKFTVRCNNCTIDGEPAVADRGAVPYSFDFMAHHDSGGKAATVTIINGDSGTAVTT